MLFREKVRVPPGWWAMDVLFAVTLAVAFGYYLGWAWALGVGLAALTFVSLGFRTASYVLEVDDAEVRVGRAVIGREWVDAVRPLDVAGTRTRSGVQADARAHLVLRPWVSTSVELTLADPADPVPYWLVSTRRPGALATALGWVAPAAEQPQQSRAPHESGQSPGSQQPQKPQQSQQPPPPERPEPATAPESQAHDRA